MKKAVLKMDSLCLLGFVAKKSKKTENNEKNISAKVFEK